MTAVACGSSFSIGCGVEDSDPPGRKTFEAPRAGEAVATLTVRCDDCAWETEGSEAVMLRVTMDGRYVQHLPVSRPGRAEYRIMLGSIGPGRHVVGADLDRALTATALRGHGQPVETIAVEQVDEGHQDYRALSLAPFVYARPDTVSRFTDVPLFMWYEIEPSPRGSRYRFSVIFTNEDGGTPTDRLMATWGRTTDIEYLYSVEVDPAGSLIEDDMQGPKHETLPYRGQREGRHPLLWVSTENNMVLDRGETEVRYGPAPVAFPLIAISREAVMDANPWLYDVMSRELVREGKVVADALPGTDTIPDPRRFVYLEGCGQAGDRALAFAIGTGARVGSAPLAWHASDRGVTEYRIVRDGCFRAATPLPADVQPADIRAVRASAYARDGRDGTAPARLTRINRLFMLGKDYVPGPSILSWEGAVTLEPGAAPFEILVQ